MKHKLKSLLSLAVIIILSIGMTLPIQADDSGDDSDVIDEKFGMPVVVYGEQLTEQQKDAVRDALNISDPDMVNEFTVTGQDAAKYIDGDPHSNMYSSAKITREEDGEGLTINIVTPDNITEVTNEMYANALLTAGVENATVDVASPVKVTGHSALTGIYKAYDVEGEALDKERMELANEELDVATDLADEDGISQEEVSELLAEIKKAISEQNPASKEDVERIITEKLDKLDISLSEEDRQMLIDLFEKMRDLDIDFDQVKHQLEDIAATVKEKMDELGLDEGFWKKVSNFLGDLFRALGDFFASLFE
ncbi:MAG TPA: DUF1002 domain-containing protein [Bacillota bacterium]|nr:DUF1002 domain-containing protein [Bacillota bacterium]